MNVQFHFIPHNSLFNSENLQKWTGAFHVVGTSDDVVCVFEDNCHFVFQTWCKCHMAVLVCMCHAGTALTLYGCDHSHVDTKFLTGCKVKNLFLRLEHQVTRHLVYKRQFRTLQKIPVNDGY